MSRDDTSHLELVRRSRWDINPSSYKSRMIRCRESQLILVQDLPPRASVSDRFDLLPVELLNYIFVSLDIQSLMCLRLVNFATKQLVEALPAYADLIKHAPETIQAPVATNLLSYFDANQLYDALLCDRCAGCNEYGNFLFLPACKRCCIDCLSDHPYMRVITVFAAKERFGEASLSGIPIMHSLPGSYGSKYEVHRGRYWLVSMHAAHMRSLFLSGSRDEMSSFLKVELEQFVKKKDRLLDSLPAWQALPQIEVAGSLP